MGFYTIQSQLKRAVFPQQRLNFEPAPEALAMRFNTPKTMVAWKTRPILEVEP